MKCWPLDGKKIKGNNHNCYRWINTKTEREQSFNDQPSCFYGNKSLYWPQESSLRRKSVKPYVFFIDSNDVVHMKFRGDKYRNYMPKIKDVHPDYRELYKKSFKK